MNERRRNERRRWGRKVTYPFIDSEGTLITKNRRRKIDRRSTVEEEETIEEELDIAPLAAAVRPQSSNNNASINISKSKAVELENALQDTNKPASGIVASIKDLEDKILDATDKKKSSNVTSEVIATENAPTDKKIDQKPAELPELDVDADVNKTANGKENSKGLSIELFIGGKKYVVTTDKDSCLIGRDPSCDIVIQSKFVSRAHAKIIIKNGKFLIEDNSFNGTYVNFNNNQKIHVSKDEQTLMTDGVMSLGKPVDDESKAVIEFKISE